MQLTNAGGLRSAPGAVVLTVSPHWAHQNKGRVAGVGDWRQEGETSVLPPALAGYPWIPAEHSWSDTAAREVQRYLGKDAAEVTQKASTV